VDYRLLLREFESRGTLVRALYYTAIIEDQNLSQLRPLVDWLDYNGYTVVTKPTKEFVDVVEAGIGQRLHRKSQPLQRLSDVRRVVCRTRQDGDVLILAVADYERDTA
jgi:uncharacterized LabA/DUF88 family protein